MVFDFCTLRMDGFVEWTFKIFDPDGSGRMEKTEFLEMCRLCMGPKAAEQGTDEYHRAIQLFKASTTEPYNSSRRVPPSHATLQGKRQKEAHTCSQCNITL